MTELVERVAYAMDTFHLEEHVDGTFFIQDRHGKVVRERLTAADEPNDIVAGMNARAMIAAMREPTEAMIAAGREYAQDDAIDTRDAWHAMIDEAMK